MSYRGLDSRVRTTCLSFFPPADSVTANCAQFVIDLARGATASMFIAVGPTAIADLGPELFAMRREEAGARQYAHTYHARGGH